MKKTLSELVEERNRLIEQDSQSAHQRARRQDIEAIEKKLGRPLTDEEKANVYGRFQGVVQPDPPRASAAHEQIRKVIDEKAKQNDPEIDALIEARDISGQFCKAVDEMHRELFPSTGLPQAPATGAEAAKEEPAHSTSSPPVELTDRETKIWEVIQRGSKGRQYCRELDSTGIVPPRNGVWKDGPRKYVAAYDLGESWRHRIEDEKAKIRSKAKRRKLAGTLASE